MAVVDEQDSSVAELEALVKIPGALKIITAEVHPDHRESKSDPKSLAKSGVDLTKPAAFVLHDVTEIEGPDAKGRYRAVSAEGDWTLGYPSALVRRLRQWRE